MPRGRRTSSRRSAPKMRRLRGTSSSPRRRQSPTRSTPPRSATPRSNRALYELLDTDDASSSDRERWRQLLSLPPDRQKYRGTWWTLAVSFASVLARLGRVTPLQLSAFLDTIVQLEDTIVGGHGVRSPGVRGGRVSAEHAAAFGRLRGLIKAYLPPPFRDRVLTLAPMRFNMPVTEMFHVDVFTQAVTQLCRGRPDVLAYWTSRVDEYRRRAGEVSVRSPMRPFPSLATPPPPPPPPLAGNGGRKAGR